MSGKMKRLEGMIPGAKHIRMGEFLHNLDYFDKEKEYIFICRSSVEVKMFAIILQEQGYKVRNMIGGMLEWNGEVIL